jgi:type 1 fimbria pilin
MKALVSFLLLTLAICSGAQTQTFNIPLLNNTYINGRFTWGREVVVDKEGLTFSGQTDKTATTYVYLSKGAKYDISLEATGKGDVNVTISNIPGDQISKNLTVKSKSAKTIHLGEVVPEKDCYIRIGYELVGTTDFLNISNLKISSDASAKPIFLSGDFNTHFGLRGPSCHLAYDTDRSGKDLEWAVIDVMVPEQFDMIGSYYMALGFNGGYFGFQNNSPSRRQVLFSVWNSADDDNPDNVAQEHRTQVVCHGDGVTAKDFGHEGSGKQTFITVKWSPDVPYRFLLHASKSDSATTDYSAWFFDSPNNKWIFMATLRRPNCKGLISGLHSFLENFSPMQGDKTRKAFYYNVWVKPKNEDWKPVSAAKLTNDLTGREGIRLDFNGGTDSDKFFLMNGGYFDREKVINRRLVLDKTSDKAPEIDLDAILKLSYKNQ